MRCCWLKQIKVYHHLIRAKTDANNLASRKEKTPTDGFVLPSLITPKTYWVVPGVHWDSSGTLVWLITADCPLNGICTDTGLLYTLCGSKFWFPMIKIAAVCDKLAWGVKSRVLTADGGQVSNGSNKLIFYETKRFPACFAKNWQWCKKNLKVSIFFPHEFFLIQGWFYLHLVRIT